MAGFALACAASAAPVGQPPAGELRSRVVIVQNAGATKAFDPQQDVIAGMVNSALTNLTRKGNLELAWRSLVTTQDVVGIKVYSAPGATSGTHPTVVAAIVEGLIKAGVQPTNIIVWDKEKRDLILAGYLKLATRYGIQVESSADAGYDEKTFYEAPMIGPLMYGDVEFGKKGEGVGRKSYVTKLVSKKLTKIINVTPLLNHYHAGVAGSLYSLAFGSVDNTFRFEQNFTYDLERLKPIPEIYALESIWDKVVLNVVDALICQYAGQEETKLQYSTTLNELRFSTDPVALDVLSLLELDKQRQGKSPTTSNTNCFKIYEVANLIGIGTSNPNNIEVERMK
jgi:uncharacterized Fe-S center protein